MQLTLRSMSADDLGRYIVTGTESYVGELIRSGWDRWHREPGT